MTTQELRNKAADYIEAHGLRRSWLTSEPGTTLTWAVLQAWEDDDLPAVEGPLAVYMAIGFQHGAGQALHWSDSEDRTAAEVIARLRGADRQGVSQ